MKKLTLTLLVLFVAGTAMADTKPLGPMNLYIDELGVGQIVNDGTVPFTFDGYSVASDSGALVNASWKTIGSQAMTPGFTERTGQPPIDLGSGDLRAASWSKMSNTPLLISEAHLEITATLQPGDFINLGAAFPGGTAEDLTFTYVHSATLESYEGLVIPEPATMSLLALGGLALIRRRR